MPRWKPLPDDLDPQIREFTGQLRRIVDQGGLGVAALADRTGYSKTSWERYLGGRLLAPLGAVIALAEATDTSPVHLTTMWELAERAWSRAESRQDRTMEQIRITQARAALGDAGVAGTGGPGAAPAPGGGDGAGVAGAASGAGSGAGTAGTGVVPVGGHAAAPDQVPGPGDTVADAVQAPSGASGAGFGAALAAGGAGSGGSPAAGGFGPAPEPGRTGGGNGRAPRTPDGTGGAAAGIAGPAGVVPSIPVQPTAADVDRAAPPAGDTGRARRTTLFAAGAAVVCVAIGAVFLFTGRDSGGDEPTAAPNSPSAAASTPQALPSGVKCAGASCAGKDAEAMGCSGGRVATVSSAVVGAVTLEVRYSRICGAAWGRITGAAPGDRVRVLVGDERPDAVTKAGDTIAYTPMVAVEQASGVRACATLAAGRTACTKPAK
ncbi:helix-turn-helix domain-containing protein [Streptomyces sp. LaPpAH-108]|uniref:helix-turn-helix domain-containing protein n=1 Tax=Streptomyces sp. LaPpAH-108 TaxID=1155714 RepID=UPI00037617EC|nr:XRE family transcriptional regulator [Streptomyces sp. LaPpAH-108]